MRMNLADREAFLRSSCNGDTSLRQSVESLLSCDATATQAGQTPVAPIAPGAVGPMPESIGDYRVLERLGAGAMGVVYLAEQPSPKRRIALKVINPARMSAAARDRFEHETAVLAKLKHPGIAAIHHAGSAEIDGATCPFFAMELVQGRALDEAAEDRSLRENVALVIDAAQAVEHAHQRGVIHRDLKPSNILVEDSGRVKVLDFGVARAIDAEGPADRAGTLPYMSPEQLAASPDADTRSDVYALGVILHQLATGKLPHDLRGVTMEEATAVVSAGLARAPRAITRGLPRDLDAIIRKALAPVADDRYPSAASLADDLRRFLETRPVGAVGKTPGYVTLRFAQRNKGLIAAMGAAVVLAVGGVVGVAWQAAEATAGWARAREEAERATAVNGFLTSMLASADPEQAMGETVTVREVLDQAARDVGAGLADRPGVRAAVELTLANTYRGLGLLDDSETHARASVEAHEAAFGVADPSTADADRSLAWTLIELGRHDEAEEILLSVIDRLERTEGVDSVEAAIARGDIARIYHERGEPTRALEAWEQALADLRREGGADSPEALVLMHNYAGALTAMGNYDEAKQRFEEVAERRETIFGADHPQTLVARSMLAGVVQKMGNDAEAAEQLRLVLEGRRRVLGDEHPGTLTSMGNLAVALIRLGELDEAERLTRAALAGYRETLGPEHAKSLVMMGNLAYLLEDRGRIDEAAAMYREVIALRESVSGGRDPETWSIYNNLGMLLMTQGQPEEAEQLFDRLLELCREQLPDDHVYTALFRNNYGACLTELGRYDQARRELEESHAVLVGVFGEGHERVTKSEGRLADLTRRVASDR